MARGRIGPRLQTGGQPVVDMSPVIRRGVGGIEAAVLDGVDVVLCLGDLCSPFIVKELGAMGHDAKAAVPALCQLVGLDKNSWQVALEQVTRRQFGPDWLAYRAEAMAGERVRCETPIEEVKGKKLRVTHRMITEGDEFLLAEG